MVTSIIISHSHASLQQYCHSISSYARHLERQYRVVVVHGCGYLLYHQLYRLVPVLFTPVQHFHSTCTRTFYTCSAISSNLSLYFLHSVCFFLKNFIITMRVHSIKCTSLLIPYLDGFFVQNFGQTLCT